MMFDFSSTARMPGLWDLVRTGRARKVCIDHHRADSLPGDLNLHLATAPATGKLVLDLIEAMGGTIDQRMAEALFVAIATDTGWFRYSNTVPDVLADAARLLSSGLDASAIYREVYQRNEVSLIRLMGRVVDGMKEELAGRLLWATIPLAQIRELGVGVFETDELLDLMRTSRDVECVLLLRELPENEVRLNLRSRGGVDVSALAKQIGGGGHRHAAGATIAGPLERAAARVVPMVREALAAEAGRDAAHPPQASRRG